MNTKTVFLLAGVFFISLALFVQGLLPLLEPQSRYTKVTRVVRTDLGELKWMESEATDYSELQALGRRVYIREGCWYCHSQYVRPVTGETRRWGPVTQSGEYAYDLPHLFSTRRIGPDLSRVGLKYSDEWHLAHFWDPRMVVPDSIMPPFAGLFDGPYPEIGIVDDAEGNRSLARNPVTEQIFDFEQGEPYLLTPNAEGLLFIPERNRYPVIHTPNDEYTGERVTLVVITRELQGLIAYVQKLGVDRGKWRDRFEPQLIDASQITIPRSAEWIAHGEAVYRRRCLGCHGAEGDGNGPAATFMYATRPRDFNFGLFKFRVTESGALPTDGDLMRTITRGVRGTAMPTWHMLPEKDRLAVILYIKFKLTADSEADPDKPYYWFVEEKPGRPLYLGDIPAPSEALVVQGKQVWETAKCWECHGDEGRGDGEKSHDLETDWGFPIRPADLTLGMFKSGPEVQDIFRTISTGINGTPMASFSDSFTESERWALSYFVLSLSAYRDPGNGNPMAISAADRRALNNPALRADESHLSYRPESSSETGARYAGDAWAVKHGIELLKAPPVSSTADARPGDDDG
jgi:cytochrome c oxidase cbb3-type subunit 2